MRWLDDPPADWDDAPEDPPVEGGDDQVAKSYENGIVVRDADDEDAYIYAWEGQRPLDDCT